MAGRVAGKVAFVTGAGHGQGRSHAIRLAEEGADIIAIDIAQPDAYPILGYATSTEEELADTVKQVEALDRRIIARQADVRDPAALKRVVDEGVAELGKLDIAIANAGICTIQTWDEVTPQIWQDTLDTNLTGVWNTMGTGLGGLNPLIERDPSLGPIYMNTLPVEMVEPRDISNAVLFLASDEAQYVTGLEFTVDAGCTIR
jgi:NAD(P)-dependent dehydrogenase (short-subunit alcohol dehydrogenase family)